MLYESDTVFYNKVKKKNSMPKLLEAVRGTETKIYFQGTMSDVLPGSATDHQSGPDYDCKSCKTKYSEKIVFLTVSAYGPTYRDCPQHKADNDEAEIVLCA
jgi:hypothetical protein